MSLRSHCNIPNVWNQAKPVRNEIRNYCYIRVLVLTKKYHRMQFYFMSRPTLRIRRNIQKLQEKSSLQLKCLSLQSHPAHLGCSSWARFSTSETQLGRFIIRKANLCYERLIRYRKWRIRCIFIWHNHEKSRKNGWYGPTKPFQ